MTSLEERFFWASFHGDLPLLRCLVTTEGPAIDPNWSLGGFTSLYAACEAGHPPVVDFLLETFPEIDVNRPSQQGTSPLAVACHYGHEEIVVKLLTRPDLGVNSKSVMHLSPLYCACQEGRFGVVRHLLADPRVDVNNVTDDLWTPFHIACCRGNADVVALMMADPRVEVTKVNENRATALYMACQNGHDSVVALLLDDPRTEVNREKFDNCTPLYHAAQNGHLPVVQRLLASDCLIDTQKRCVTDDPEENNKTAAEWVGYLVVSPRPAYMTEDTHERVVTCGNALASLLDSYDRNPTEVRFRVRRLPHLRGMLVPPSSALPLLALIPSLRSRFPRPSDRKDFCPGGVPLGQLHNFSTGRGLLRSHSLVAKCPGPEVFHDCLPAAS